MKTLTLILTLGIIIIAAACGRGGSDARITPDTDGNGTISQPRGTDTLRILAPIEYEPILREAERLMSLREPIDIEITVFCLDTQAHYWAGRLPSILAAGYGFDIFFNDPRMPLFQLAQEGWLADINELIRGCGNRQMIDYYTQALHALTIDGRLSFFPLGFGLQYVGINAEFMPPEIVNRFMAMDSITTSQMMEMFIDAGPQQHPNRDHNLLLANCRAINTPGFMAWNMANQFTDINSRSANLTSPEFIRFLENMLEIFPDPQMTTPGIEIEHNLRVCSLNAHFGTIGYFTTPYTLYRSVEYYAFSVQNQFLNPLNAIIPFTGTGEQPFIGYIPLADTQGRLVTNMATSFPWKTISIVANENATLAWEFVSQYLLQASVCQTTTPVYAPVEAVGITRPSVGATSFDTPIAIDIAHSHIESILNLTQEIRWTWRFEDTTTGQIVIDAFPPGWSMTIYAGLPLEGIFHEDPTTSQAAIQTAIQRLDYLHSQPLAPMLFLPFELVEHSILNMLRWHISPTDAAAALDSTINAWLASM
ncbi:MAG: hypothetical protein FWC78_07270 [Defluviitaleaceae bacterium]|nr:hypothetical protein [Defluviitaleaceae bacterium]